MFPMEHLSENTVRFPVSVTMVVIMKNFIINKGKVKGRTTYIQILANRGHHGSTSDLWSCGVILYVVLTSYLPFDDRNLAILYQKIFRGDVKIPKWLPNPKTRITVVEIKEHDWF
ncbi:hypothetical protein IFM89_005958, partial [Coptis chinensis]